MKIELKELKKAIAWVEANTNALNVEVICYEGNKLIVKTMDKQDAEVEITLFSDSQMLPKIKKTDILR